MYVMIWKNTLNETFYENKFKHPKHVVSWFLPKEWE